MLKDSIDSEAERLRDENERLREEPAQRDFDEVEEECETFDDDGGQLQDGDDFGIYDFPETGSFWN